MAANVETMFYVRETPWHGLGTRVMEAPNSKDALRLAGLDWTVKQEPIYTKEEILIPGYQANVRDSDDKVLGVVKRCGFWQECHSSISWAENRSVLI